MERCSSSEGPALFEAFGEEEQSQRDEKDADRNGGAKWPIKRCAEETLDDVGDHGAGGAADEKWREEIAEGKNEGKGCAGEQSGK